jgi:hypothetical protein
VRVFCSKRMEFPRKNVKSFNGQARLALGIRLGSKDKLGCSGLSSACGEHFFFLSTRASFLVCVRVDEFSMRASFLDIEEKIAVFAFCFLSSCDAPLLMETITPGLNLI